MDFLSEENVCGQNLLKLVSRGSAILAELQRLSDYIPKVFYGYTLDNKKYDMILFDFEYLKNVDFYEDRIQQNTELLDLDENFRETYFPLLERFFILFESIFKYYSDFTSLTEEINQGIFIQYSMENILNNAEGKKLMGESIYLYGCMLMLMDNFMIGSVREKIIISYYRYKGGQSAIQNINEVCKLCKNTGYLPAQFNGGIVKRPSNYPEEFFARFTVDQDLITSIIGSTKDDDIYRQLAAYPHPDHRSVALANQASMLFIILYFNSNILNKENAKMREIVDKHFYDNWVVPYYMGYIIDLSEQWAPYKAAKSALSNTIDPLNVKELSMKYNSKMEEYYKKCKDYLNEGVLTEEFVLEKVNQLLLCLRESNVAVRWLMLQRATLNKKLRDIINETVKMIDILSLLLVCSQFESLLKKMFENLIESKQARWDEDKNSSSEKMDELSDYFSGTRPLSKVSPDESYKKWFLDMKEQISSLTYNDSTYAGRKIQQLIKALEDVEQYHQIANNMQIKQYLYETRLNLKHMVRTVHIKKQVLSNLALISDISYSWQCLKDYSKMMQDKIKKDPSTALLLKASFMKLSSIMNAPMVRIIQANSPDFVSVSKYYSGELIKFVKEVLQIIPISVFDLLEEIIVLLTSKLKKIPLKLNRAELKDYAQYEERTKMANLTHQISVFTESILNMETYLIGVIEVDPKVILEDGIRKEIIKLICKILDKILVFRSHTVEDFEARLQNLAENLEGFKKSLEYIQDFVNIYGLKIFNEEFNRLINCYIDMEVNAFLNNRLTIEELSYDEDIPMPDLKTAEQGSVNFMGRLLKEMLSLTHSRSSIYVDITSSFFDTKSEKETLNMKSISMIHRCIGVSGLNGLDRLLCYNIISKMRYILKLIPREVDSQTKKILGDSFNELKSITSFVDKYEKVYTNLKRILKGLLVNLLNPILFIGQCILLRKLICRELLMTARIGSNKIFLSLENLNKSLMNDLTNRSYDSELNSIETIVHENNMIFEVSKMLNFIGMSDPLRKIYITSEPIEQLPLIMSLLVNNEIPNLVYNQKLAILTKRNKKEGYDGTCFMLGILAFLNQFHKSNTDIFMGLTAQYINNTINYSLVSKESKQNSEVVPDLMTYLSFFEEFARYSEGDIKKSEKYGHLLLLNSLDKDLMPKN